MGMMYKDGWVEHEMAGYESVRHPLQRHLLIELRCWKVSHSFEGTRDGSNSPCAKVVLGVLEPMYPKA